MQNALFKLLPALLVLALAACGSSSPVRYFTLQPIDTEFQQDTENAVMLGLGPLRMPEYLNRSQLVLRGDSSEILVDEFHRWSEPLNKSILRIVAADVDNLLEDVVVVEFPFDSHVRNQVEYRLLGDVSRFDADSTGRIVLDVQWGITSIKGDSVVSVRRYRYQAQAADPADPGAVVVAMNDALAQFSRDIAGRLEAAL